MKLIYWAAKKSQCTAVYSQCTPESPNMTVVWCSTVSSVNPKVQMQYQNIGYRQTTHSLGLSQLQQ